MTRFSILGRVIALSVVLLAVLIGSNSYLGRQILQDADILIEEARLVSAVTAASNANKSFGDLKYWLTDLAVSLLVRAEVKAEEARSSLNIALNDLEQYDAEAVVAIRIEVGKLMKLALLAVDAYTDDERVLGNSLMATSRTHIRVVDERLSQLTHRLQAEALKVRDAAILTAQRAADLSVIIIVLASIFGLTLTFLVFRSIQRTLAERDRLAAQRALAEETLAEREERLNAIVTTVADGIVTIDHHGTISTINPAALRIFGYAENELLGMNVSNLMSERDRILHDGFLRHYMTTGVARLIGRSCEVVGRTKDGREFPLQLAVSEMEVGGEKMFAGILRDVTELKQREHDLLVAKEEAELGNRAKSEFLANMSHELRTPLNAIIGFSEIMANATFGPLGAPRYKEYAEDIHYSGTHLLAIINDILDMSKIEAGDMPLNENEVDVAAAIASSLRLINEKANSLSVALSCNFADNLPRLHADERLLKQMLLNLLSNAVKFSLPKSRVDIGARIEPAGGLEITVTDTGIGIAPENIELVTKPFHQVESTLDRKFEGTGLGLPLVKSIIERHGGTLTIESEIGAGTRVTILFPAQRVLDDAAAPRAHGPMLSAAN